MTPDPSRAPGPVAAVRSRCPLCAPADPPVEEVVAHGPHRVVRCTGCALVRLHAFPSSAEIGAIVDDAGYGLTWEVDYRREPTLDEVRASRGYRNAVGVQAQLFRVVARAGLDPRAPLRYHDIGCSDGTSLHLAREAGWRVSGNDLSPTRRDFSRRVYDIDFPVGYFAACEIAPGSLDLVSIRHVLEHVPDPLAELALVRERLAPRGVLVLEVPNFSSPTLRVKLARQRLGLRRRGLDFIGVPEHHWQFTAATLRRLLDRAGFDVVRSETSSGFVNHAPWVRALIAATVHRAGLGTYLLVAARRRA